MKTTSGKIKKHGIITALIVTLTVFVNATFGQQMGKNTLSSNQKTETSNMKRVLIIGMNPHTIDFSNPELPKGINAEIIEKGTLHTLEKLKSEGYQAESFLINTGAKEFSALIGQLKKQDYDGIVIGNGIRGISANFSVFEQVINVVHAHAPRAKIIFNTLPTNTDEAVKRWL